MMKQPRPATPSQKNKAATVTLGLLTLVFLLIPVLVHRPTVVVDSRPTVAEALSGQQTYAGPPVPSDMRPWPEKVEPAWAPSSEFTARLQRMGFMLAGMGLVIWMSLKLLDRFGLLRSGKRRRGVTPMMEVLERQAVAPGVNLALVRVGDKTMVLGFTENSVSTVCQLTAEEWQAMQDRQQAEVEEVVPAPAPEPSQVYGQIFRQYLSIIPGWGTKR